MQTVEKPSSVSVDEPKSNPLLNGQHLSSPSSSSSEECASNGDSADSTSKNGSEVPPPDPTSGILSPFRLSEEKLGHIQITKNSTNRVKLYILCDQRTWDDRGTGHVACVQYPEDSSEWYLIVRLESNENNVLESLIHNETVYQRQQGTLIVWSESDTCDLALSFQEKSGCAAIWDRICQIQGRDPDVDDEEVDDQQSDSSNSNASSGLGISITLPACTLTTIQEIDQIIINNMANSASREKMASTLQQQNYIAKLVEVFRMSEDVGHPNLQYFHSIAKNLFLLNSNLMLDELLNDNYFKDIVGMLEYDPSSPEHPRKHREFLFEKSKFKEVLPIKTEELKHKIQLNYRVQYVQDVCLPAPSLFEENLLTCMSSRLFFARAEIVSQLIGDKELMRQLFDELKSTDTKPHRRRDLTQFLREFCSFIHSLQTQSSAAGGREQFFKTILTNDMLSAINLCISQGSPSTRTSAIEIVNMIVEYNPMFMRDFLLRQTRSIAEDKPEEVLLNKIVGLIMKDSDAELGMANTISTMIKNLLDSDNAITLTSMGRVSPRSMIEKQSSSKNDKLDFFSMFYSRIIETLVKPLFDNVSDGKLIADNYFKANQMALILELISFCVENHVQSMRNFVIQKDLLSTIGCYLQSHHHFMSLSALRVLRKVVQQKDEQYNRHIIEKKVVDPIVDCFVANGDRYNLLNSAILEFFEFIRHHNIYPLMNYVLKNHYDSVLKNITYTKLFEQMKIRNDAKENTANRPSDEPPSFYQEESRRPLNAQWAREREYDSDERFFNQEDEDEDDEVPFVDSESLPTVQKFLPKRKIAMEPIYPPTTKRKLNTEADGVGSIFGGSLSPGISSGTTRISISKIKLGETIREKDELSDSLPPNSSSSASSFTVSNLSSPPAEPENKRPKFGTPIPKPFLVKQQSSCNLVGYDEDDDSGDELDE